MNEFADFLQTKTTKRHFKCENFIFDSWQTSNKRTFKTVNKVDNVPLTTASESNNSTVCNRIGNVTLRSKSIDCKTSCIASNEVSHNSGNGISVVVSKSHTCKHKYVNRDVHKTGLFDAESSAQKRFLSQKTYFPH